MTVDHAQSLRIMSETQVKSECPAPQLAAVEQVFLAVHGVVSFHLSLHFFKIPFPLFSFHSGVAFSFITPGRVPESHTSAVLHKVHNKTFKFHHPCLFNLRSSTLLSFSQVWLSHSSLAAVFLSLTPLWFFIRCGFLIHHLRQCS